MYLILQVIFKKNLSQRQWISLILLTCGCMIKQLNFGPSSTEVSNGIAGNYTVSADAHNTIQKNTTGFTLSINAVFILIQVVCSCLAGVYNEYLLKNQGADVNIYIQNVFMYLDSIVCNSLVLLLQGNLSGAFTATSLKAIFRFNVILIMVNNAAIGIVTSFFLKYMNSILKTFASALELLFTAVLCYILFAMPIYLNTILAIGVVSFSIYLYSQNPVVNSTSASKLPYHLVSDSRKLLENNSDIDDV